MDRMAMKRTSLHLDDRDLKALERLAKAETQRTGSRVSASQVVRRLIREFLHNQPSFGFAQGLERTIRWYREHASTLFKVSGTQLARESGEDRVVNKRSHNRTPEAIIVRDHDGTIRYWSREAELMYGWTPQEVLGTRTHNLFKTKFPTSLAVIEKQVREKTSWQGQLIHRRRDGSLVTVNSRWNIQHNPQNKSLTVIEVNAESAS
jgi:PAS domain S-box-containing protein